MISDSITLLFGHARHWQLAIGHKLDPKQRSAVGITALMALGLCISIPQINNLHKGGNSRAWHVAGGSDGPALQISTFRDLAGNWFAEPEVENFLLANNSDPTSGSHPRGHAHVFPGV